MRTTWLATVIFAGLGLIREELAAVQLSRQDWLAVGYLAAVVISIAM